MFGIRRLAVAAGMLALAAVAATAQTNPFVGKWNVDIAYVPETLVLEFHADGTYTVSAPDVNGAQSFTYSLDAATKTINMGKFQLDPELPSTTLRYEFDAPSTFHLYVPEDQLAEALQQSESASNPTDKVTEFTKQYQAEITRQTAKAISRVPIGEGKRM